MPTETEQAAEPVAAPFPDLRQSLCHTLLAAAFVLLGVLNPFAGSDGGVRLHWWVMGLLVIFALISWFFAAKTWVAWQKTPRRVRLLQIEAARLDRNRAQSHGLMSALSLLLTGFAFLGGAFIPEITEGTLNRILFGFAVLIAVLSAAILTRVIRDWLIRRKHHLSK